MKAYNLDLARTDKATGAIQALMDTFGWAAHPGHRPRAHRHSHDPHPGPARHHRPARHRRGREHALGWPLRVIEHAGNEPAIQMPEVFLQVLCRALGNSLRRVTR